MLDFSWSEFLVVIVVAVLAVGPKQLPEVLHGLGKLFRRLQYMRYALTRQFDDFMDQADLKDLRDHTSRMIPTDYFDEALADEEHQAVATSKQVKDKTTEESKKEGDAQ